MTIEELAGVHREIHTAEGEILLRTTDLTMKFGGLTALDSVSFDIRRGEILGMIGPNGAGKTTCFNAITGCTARRRERSRSTARHWAGSNGTRSPAAE